MVPDDAVHLSFTEAFPYLGQTIAYDNSNCVAVNQNLRKAWRRQGIVVRVLERMGAVVRARGEIYNAVA